MQNEIVKLLDSTLKPDKNTIKQATLQLGELRKQHGFYITLMMIASDTQQRPDIRQSALANLKISVERRWMMTDKWKVDAFIENSEKIDIRSNLLQAMISANRDSRYINLWKAIVKQVVMLDYKTWLPLQDIISALKTADIHSVLQYTLAVIDALETPLDDRSKYLQILNIQLLPILYTIVQTYKTSDIIFLTVKIVWKSFHMGLDDGSKQQSFRWIPVLLDIINYHSPDIAENYKVGNIKKNTPEFYYFHTQKWAIRLLYRFLHRHANSKYHRQNEAFSNLFYNTFGTAVTTALLGQVDVPLIPKAKYFLLKALTSIVETRSSFIEHELVNLLYVKLPPFLTLTPADEKLAKEDPMELLKRELDPIQMYTNVKQAAMDLWSSINELGSVMSLKECAPGKYLYQSMEYLQSKLISANLLEKEMAMYMLCQLRPLLMKIGSIKTMIPSLIKKYVIPEFTNKEMFLRARSVEMFTGYGSINFPNINVLKNAVQGIYFCLAHDTERIVNIKAACAFNSILTHKEAIQMVRPHLKSVLQIYITLLQKNEYEEIVESLEGIVTHFSDSIGPYAVQLIMHISRMFGKYCHIQQANNNCDEEGEIAALACLSTITKIIDSPLPADAVAQIQESIVPIISYAFTDEGVQYMEDAVNLLASYLFKAQTITQRVWFFYPVIMYQIMGINKQKYDFSKVPDINPLQKQIFSSLGKQRLQKLGDMTPSLRLYIYKGSNIVLQASDFFDKKLLALVFELTDMIYHANPDDFEELECQQSTMTSILIHLLESIQGSEQLVTLIWQVVKTNLAQKHLKSKFLTNINIQLISICLYSMPVFTITKMQSDGLVDEILKIMVKNQKKYIEEWQKQRIVLGLSSLLRIAPKPQSVNKHLCFIFKMLRDIVKQICNMRMQQEAGQESQTQTEDNDASESQNDDIWDELHMVYYKSGISQLDQVQFLEDSLRLMQIQQPALYLSMIEILDADELSRLKKYIQSAKSNFLRKQQKLKKVSSG